MGLVALLLLVPAAPLTGDGAGYVEFVRNGLQHGASTWHERRLLGPAMVRVLPLDPLQGFRVLTLASLAATALLTWRTVDQLSQADALLAIPLLLGTWVVAPNLREYALVDPLAWAFVAAIWLCTVRRQWLMAAALAAIGVLAKEVVALAGVAAAAAAWDARQPWRSVAVAAPALAVVLLLTLVLPGSGSDAGAYVAGWVRDGLASLGVPRALYFAFASYGALWLLLPAGWPALPRYLRRAGAVYVLAGLALPLVGSPERMEEAIFPIVVTTAALAVGRLPAGAAWAVALGNLLFLARVGGDAPIPPVVAWLGLASACGLALFRPARAVASRLSLRRAAPRGTTAPSR